MAHVPNRAILVHVADLCLAEPVQLARAHRIQVDGKGKGDEETNERHHHGDMVAATISHEARQGGEERAAADGGDDPGGAALSVAAEAADRECEDGGEDGGLEEEDDGQKGDAAFAVHAHGRRDEDHDHRHEEHEDPPRLGEHHATRGEEAADGEQTLADGVAIRGRRVADVGALDGVLDELRRHADLGAHVAELSGDAKEELVLASHGLVHVAGESGALFRLQGHVGIGDFRDGREEEDNSEEEDKDGNAKVSPLHVREVLGIRVFEKDP